MAKDLGEMVSDAVGQIAREAVQNFSDGRGKKSSGGMPGSVKGAAAGAGIATLVPLAMKGAKPIKRMLSGDGSPLQGAAEKAGDKVGGNLKETVSDKVEEAGGAGGLVKEAAKGIMPGGGDSG